MPPLEKTVERTVTETVEVEPPRNLSGEYGEPIAEWSEETPEGDLIYYELYQCSRDDELIISTHHDYGGGWVLADETRTSLSEIAYSIGSA